MTCPSAGQVPAGELRFDVFGGVATLTFNCPRRKALTAEFCDLIADALRRCEADPQIRAIVLTGAGGTFSTGADLLGGPTAAHDVFAGDGALAPDYREPASRITAAMDALDVPVVAAVNGDAAGGGATITLGADLRVCSVASRFVLPFTRLDLCPEGGSTYRLPRLVGPSRSVDWLLSGRRVDSAEAIAAGLVTSVLPAEEVLPAAQAWAHQVAARCAPGAVATTRAMLRACPADPAVAAARESRAIVDLSARPDRLEGVAAFLERREPRFSERLQMRAPA